MGQIAYTVIATVPDPATAREYVNWLQAEHIGRVLAAGALSATIVRIEHPSHPIQIEARYIFASRAAFEQYLLQAAPRLRAEGQARFPPHRGVTWDRRLGTVIEACSPTIP